VETFENNDPKVDFMKGEISESSALIPQCQSENADKFKDQQVEMLMEGEISESSPLMAQCIGEDETDLHTNSNDLVEVIIENPGDKSLN